MTSNGDGDVGGGGGGGSSGGGGAGGGGGGGGGGGSAGGGTGNGGGGKKKEQQNAGEASSSSSSPPPSSPPPRKQSSSRLQPLHEDSSVILTPHHPNMPMGGLDGVGGGGGLEGGVGVGGLGVGDNNDDDQRIVNMEAIGGMSMSSASVFPLSQEELKMKEEEETFYSARDNKFGDDNVWGLLSGVAGNVYEWYDFAVYGLLASEIGAAFFPDSSPELQLINSFGVHLGAFIVRPLGAILFGELGDRIAGRKNALMMSIVLITVPSVLMGLLPTYKQWGPISAVFLVLLRMMQGLSVGGQLAGSYVLSIEQSSSSNRGFRGSICDASSVGGFLLASFVTTCVRKIFTAEQVNDWAWRVPFLLSTVLAPLLYYIVRNAEESKFWTESKDQKETEKIIRESEPTCESKRPAVLDLFSSPFRRRQLFGMVGVLSPLTSSYYMLFLWSPLYLSHIRGHISEANADLMNVFTLVLYIVLILIGGKLSDSLPHRMDLMRIGLPGIIVAAPTMFGMYESESVAGYVLAQVQYAICMSLFQGGVAAWKVELWMADPTLSYTGVAIGHNVASCLFGGTLPLIATALAYYGDVLANNSEAGDDALWPRLIPGLYLSLLGCLSLYCLSYVIRHPHDIRTGEKKIRDAYNHELRRKKKKSAKKMKQRKMAFEGYLTNPTSSFLGSDLNSAASPATSNNYVPPSSSNI